MEEKSQLKKENQEEIISLKSIMPSRSNTKNESPLNNPPPKRYELDAERRSETVKFSMQVSDDYAMIQHRLKNLEEENNGLVELIEECFSSDWEKNNQEWRRKVKKLFEKIVDNRIPKKELPVRTIDGYFNIGMYHDKYPGELFIHAGKEGDETHGFVNSFGKAISVMLQYGIEPEKIYRIFKYNKFQPKGITNLKEAPFCKSIIDMIMKYMEANFIPTVNSAGDDNEYNAIIECVTDKELK